MSKLMWSPDLVTIEIDDPIGKIAIYVYCALRSEIFPKDKESMEKVIQVQFANSLTPEVEGDLMKVARAVATIVSVLFSLEKESENADESEKTQ